MNLWNFGKSIMASMVMMMAAGVAMAQQVGGAGATTTTSSSSKIVPIPALESIGATIAHLLTQGSISVIIPAIIIAVGAGQFIFTKNSSIAMAAFFVAAAYLLGVNIFISAH